MTVKTITSRRGIHTTTITRADWSIKFWDYDTRRHYERRVWWSRGGDIIVQLHGHWVEVVTERDGQYDPWACLKYTEVH